MKIKVKRIYEKATKTDGVRVLVDRIWPRGVSKEDAQLDEWLKEIAPSAELRKWFSHDKDRFLDFARNYKNELKDHSGLIEDLLEKWKEKSITLLYGAKDEKHNQAVVLKEFLEQQNS